MGGKDGVVVDANIISIYNYEFAKGKKGDIFNLVTKILKNCRIAITYKIEREWRSTCGGQFFDVWYTDNVRDGYIQLVTAKIDGDILKKIHIKFGLPRKGMDAELIKAANVTKIKYILTNDIHLFDPKKKQASGKEKNRIKKNRTGALCRFLKKKPLYIIVGMPEHCCRDLECLSS